MSSMSSARCARWRSASRRLRLRRQRRAAGEARHLSSSVLSRRRGKEFVGLVLQDKRVLDIAAANAAFEKRNAKARKISAPRDMKELIARYERDVGPRLRELAAANANVEPGSASYVYAIDCGEGPASRAARGDSQRGCELPGTCAGNHRAGRARRSAAGGRHAGAPGLPEAAGTSGRRAPAQDAAPRRSSSAPGLWERPPDDKRPDNPYLFLKSPSVVVGANDDVVIPKGREQIDWECEFAVVVGQASQERLDADATSTSSAIRSSSTSPIAAAATIARWVAGPDWFIQKNHDTFAPIGPFIVPKEFLPNPMNTRHYFTLNGEMKQDANTSQMEYNIAEMLSFASNVLTLNPGDMLSMGTPSGTNIDMQGAQRWMKAGDVGVCVVDGVGEQRHNIVAQK